MLAMQGVAGRRTNPPTFLNKWGLSRSTDSNRWFRRDLMNASLAEAK
jgi:hypothetical protein